MGTARASAPHSSLLFAQSLGPERTAVRRRHVRPSAGAAQEGSSDAAVAREPEPFPERLLDTPPKGEDRRRAPFFPARVWTSLVPPRNGGWADPAYLPGT